MRSNAFSFVAMLCCCAIALACAQGSEGTDASSAVDATALPDGPRPPDASTTPDARPPADAPQLPDAAPLPDAALPPDAAVVIDANPGCTLSEGFESGTVPPAGWTKVDFNAAENWVADNFDPHSGAWNAHVIYDEALAAQNEVLISPQVNCSGMTLSFWVLGSYYWAVDPETNYEGALWAVVGDWDEGATDDVLISNTILADLAAAQGGTFENFVWYQVSYPIPSALDNQPIRFAWQYYGTDGAELGLDDVQLN